MTTAVNACENADVMELFGHRYPKLIAAKRAAGRTKDLLVPPELEAILEFQEARGNRLT